MRALIFTWLWVSISPAAAQWPATDYILLEVVEPGVIRPNHGARQAVIGPRLRESDQIESTATVIGAAGDSTELGCSAIAEDLAGRIAVIRRGGCTFARKILNAQAAGAVAVIVYNNVAPDSPEDSVFVLIGGDSTGIAIPSAFARAAAGQLLRSLDTPVLRYGGTGRCFDYGGAVDTTAPWRYMPLAAGNAWEYLFESDFGEPEYRQRFDVERDTLVEGTRYFIVRDARYDVDDPQSPTSVSRSLVRYDSSRAHLMTLFASGEEGPHRLAMCPLAALHGTMENNCAGSWWSWEVTAPGVTRWYTTCYTGIADLGGEVMRYVADRGLVEHAGWSAFEPGFNRYGLVYSRVSGVEIGTPVAWPVAAERAEQSSVLDLRVSPDPASERATVSFVLETPAAVWIEMLDVLGRRVGTYDLGRRPAGAGEVVIFVSGLAPGRYTVRLLGEGDLHVAVPLVVAR